MSYTDEWRALSARLKGLESAARLHLMIRNVETNSEDPRTKEDLFPVSSAIFVALRDFQAAHANHLPESAKIYLDEFFRVSNTYFAESKSYSPHGVYKSLVRLSALDAEMTYLLADTQEQIRSRTELAFAHLQNLIHVDKATRSAWIEAFKDGETACERLGKVHLLFHGILGFKADCQAGGRTDLIFHEPPDASLLRSVVGLVLTEWKVARKPDDPDDKLAEARDQAARYTEGPLDGIELSSLRYAVVVTELPIGAGPIDARPDVNRGGYTYRHINIAVNPANISKEAKRAGQVQRKARREVSMP